MEGREVEKRGGNGMGWRGREVSSGRHFLFDWHLRHHGSAGATNPVCGRTRQETAQKPTPRLTRVLVAEAREAALSTKHTRQKKSQSRRTRVLGAEALHQCGAQSRSIHSRRSETANPSCKQRAHQSAGS